MNIGFKIKELRRSRGLTQEQLAESIGVSFQAVSKWENNISLPDIALVPMIATYFGVSMDVLFDYNLKEIEDKVMDIARESWKFRDTDRNAALTILDEGLKEYPNNDVLLINRLYVMNVDETPDEVIEIAYRVIDHTRDVAVKYDACQFLAYAYKAKGDLEGAKRAIDLIPDIRFSNQRLKACILEGEDKWNAACQEFGEAMYSLTFITKKMSECFIERGEIANAILYLESALKMLDNFEVIEDWYGFRESFRETLDKLKGTNNDAAD